MQLLVLGGGGAQHPWTRGGESQEAAWLVPGRDGNTAGSNPQHLGTDGALHLGGVPGAALLRWLIKAREKQKSW